MQPLPIDSLIPEITAHLARHNCLVIEAPPGAGKTTRVPPALLGPDRGEVLVLEPRRLAARLAARRVAAEMGERVGQTVGYQVRFDSVGSPETRLRFLTEGVLTRRLLSNPTLAGVGTVILDEFHERHLEGDLALALLRGLQKGSRPDLRLVVMSATLDSGPVVRFLGDCSVVRSEGRLYPLDIQYTPHSATPLEEQVSAALARLLAVTEGNVLIFLPGAAEIRRAIRTCGPAAQRAGADLLPLHGSLSPEEQDRAVLPSARRKVILSTNVAESSITIEGVTAVIDSGLARVATDSPWTGLPTLNVARISKASADQRAGRAGRTAPGTVIRLYPEADYVRRPMHEAPEISRRELSQVCLDLRLLGTADIRWLDEPPAAALDAAETLLARLGAIDPDGEITDLGREMATMPLHPRLARLVVESGRRGVSKDGCALAALLSAGERLPAGEADQWGPSDLLVLLESNWTPQARRLVNQIRGFCSTKASPKPGTSELLISVLAAFPDRVARRRRRDELLLASGGSAMLDRASVVKRGNFMVAVDVEDRRERSLPIVRLASAIEPEWLLDLYPERIRDRNEVEWNRSAERVEGVSALLFDQIVLSESRGGNADPEAAANLLAGKAIEAGIHRFADPSDIDAFLARAAFAAQHSDLPELTAADVQASIEGLCYGLKSFRELTAAARKGGLLRTLRARLTRKQLQLLNELAPERLQLPSGRRARIHYAPDKPPWLASRLQDFFGLRETPRIARGQVPLVLHLLAPNQRPVQTTTDLAGFWERLYPKVRRELSRRYPKHAWPEIPGA